MYEESGASFDESSSLHRGRLIQTEDGFSQTHTPNYSFSMEGQSCPQNPFSQQQLSASAPETEFQPHLEMEHCTNWQQMTNFNGELNQYQNSPYPTTPDLLNHSGFLASLNQGPLSYDPLNLLPQPLLFRDLLHSLPNEGYTVGSPRIGSGVDEGDGNGPGLNEESQVFYFNAGETDSVAKNRDGKVTKHFATEKYRRVLLKDKYKDLRALVPNPSKDDRASIVGDAICYINELKRTVSELKVLVEQKRCARERLKRPKTEDVVIEGKALADLDNPLRTSWLQRKSRNTEVDVRIIDDEVTVKLIQQKRINCLVFVARALDELHLDLHHVAGGVIGDYYSYLFNSKICEGSIVYASGVANKVIEVVDKQYASIPTTNSY